MIRRKQETGERAERKKIPASQVGVSLAISAEALREVDRNRQASIKGLQNTRHLVWR